MSEGVGAWLLAAAVLTATSAPASMPDEARAALEDVPGVNAKGEATSEWLAMIRKRLTAEEFSGIAALVKPLTEQERRWSELIRSHAVAWEGRRAGLAVPFAPVVPPPHVLIVMGNRGGSDAFTHDPRTIGFDLSALQASYGDAGSVENSDRIDRLFDHEYTHLLQKAWLPNHPYQSDTPLRAALLDIWLEGLGNYRSLSQRWRASGGRSSQAAAETLSKLEPRFAARMAALACASPELAGVLMKDLSQGPFESKWGALPAALWLEDEASVDPEALHKFVAAGPDAIWDLAARHLPPDLAAVLAQARQAASSCTP